MTVGTVTDRGLHPKRAANEDRLLVLPESGLLLVADGVGGRRAGQVASQTAVDIFSEIFAARPHGNVLDLLKLAVAESNQRIYEASTEVEELHGMATTLAVVAVDGARAIIGHVGDSRVYRFDGQRLTCETEDHSEVAEAMRSGELTAVQAARHPGRNVITRALGIEPEVTADFDIIALNERTSLLLCSDGITRHIPDRELEEVMKSGAHPQSICDKLKELCYARGAEDNLTAVVVDFGERGYVEEQTRPMTTVRPTGTTADNSANNAASSRISVDFSKEPETTRLSARFGRQAKQAAGGSSRQNKSKGGLLGGALLQLLLLGLLLAGAFLAGRYYDQIYALIWGKPVMTSTAGGQTGDKPVTAEQAQANPDLAAARGLFQEKRFEPARQSFAGLVSKEPANAEYRYWLGRTQLELKQYQDAVKNLNEALRLDAKLNEKLPGVYLHLALAYDALNNRQGVSENLRRAAAQ
ncbi:MAG TPA: protein phosphatase 2C domain-containing protein [Blastocatellia bacterium]|nr:protein phosphatase 2C domain-containing protein [Blastocatellia bacterium]